jgi:uncharacterized protein (DUF2147 family)
MLRAVIFIVTLLGASIALAASPVGYWQTIDDSTKQPKSIVKITELPDHSFQGQIVKLYANPSKICTSCTDARKDQPLMGMKVIEGMRAAKSSHALWNRGNILDPKNGKIYHCNLQLTDNNTKLVVRGYLGVPLFGRSQTWNKVSASD